MCSKEFLGLEQTKRWCALIRVSLTVNQKLCPKIEDGCPGKIFDVNIPASVEACADHQTRVAIEQDLARIVERADLYDCLASKTGSFATDSKAPLGSVSRDPASPSKDAQFVSYPIHRAFRGDAAGCVGAVCGSLRVSAYL